MTVRILLATTNSYKISEIRSLLSDCPVELVGLDELGFAGDEPLEDGLTFEANAIKKGCFYAIQTNCLCLSDDSGLEVDVLGGEPGVRSARFAGLEGPRQMVDRANNRLLLERLGETSPKQRTARFVCVMVLCAPPEALPSLREEPVQVGLHSSEGLVLAVARGTIEGQILTLDEAVDSTNPVHLPEAGRGVNGFGYDPLFLVPGLGRTTAELTPEQKNRISHRGQASRQMKQKLLGLFGDQ